MRCIAPNSTLCRRHFSHFSHYALHCGNARNDIFFKDRDFRAFERVIKEGLDRYAVDLIAYPWMSNHWHMVLSPQDDTAMSSLLGWVTMTHTQRYHAHNKTTGYGHVDQGRFKSFPVQNNAHFHTVCRYVERNALTAGIVERTEDYRWGSLWNWCGGNSVIKLSPWPVKRLPGWIERVNEPLTTKEKDALRNCVQRGRPYGTEKWANATAKAQRLEITLRPRGRPRTLA